MKLSTKIFLPIILISALLILLSGCFLAPSEEQPALTLYTVTYDRNGDDVTGTVPVDANLYKKGDLVTVLGNTGTPVLVNTGYDFYGWNTAADGSGISLPVGYVFAMVTSDVTLYAMWDLSPGATSGEEDTGGGGFVGGGGGDPCAGNTAPIIDTIDDDQVVAGADFDYDVTVTDPDVPTQTLTYSIAVTIGSPANAPSITKDGADDKKAHIDWTSADSADIGKIFEFTVTVEDGCLAVDTEVFELEVTDPCCVDNTKPEITSLAPITLDFEDTYSYTVEVKDDDVCPIKGEGCQTLTFTLLEGPAGMVIDDTFGGPCKAELTWTPECDDLTWVQVCTGGDCSDQYKSVVDVKIEVDDGCCDPVEKEFDITVYSSNKPPKISELYTFFRMPTQY